MLGCSASVASKPFTDSVKGEYAKSTSATLTSAPVYQATLVSMPFLISGSANKYKHSAIAPKITKKEAAPCQRKYFIKLNLLP